MNDRRAPRDVQDNAASPAPRQTLSGGGMIGAGAMALVFGVGSFFAGDKLAAEVGPWIAGIDDVISGFAAGIVAVAAMWSVTAGPEADALHVVRTQTVDPLLAELREQADRAKRSIVTRIRSQLAAWSVWPLVFGTAALTALGHHIARVVARISNLTSFQPSTEGTVWIRYPEECGFALGLVLAFLASLFLAVVVAKQVNGGQQPSG